MKTRIIKSILVLLLIFVAMPIMGQDFLEIHLKNGDFRKFYLKNVTEISISGIDADGILHNDHNYQHLTTINGKYIYSIEDIDSILFTRKDEEIAEKNFAKAMSSIVPTLSTCETIDDVENKINQIKSAEGVENAWSDGHMLYVSIAEGETFSFHFDHEADLNIGYYENAAAKLKAMIPPMKTSVKQNDAKLKAVIINQQHKDESRAYKISNIQDLVKGFYACDIEATYVDEPTIDFFYDNCHNPGTAKHLNIYDYDLILLTTHGGYGDTRFYSPRVGLFVHDDYRWGLRCHQIETSEDIGDPFKSKGEDDEGDDVDFNEKWLDYYKHFKEWRDGTVCGDASDQHINFAFQNELRKGIWYWVAHPVLTEHFFRDIAKGHFNNPKSILFNAACGSLQGDDEYSSSRFANELLKRDLGVYLGYTETNSTGFWAGLNFYYNMLSGKSVEQSRESLISCQKEETEETFKEWKVDKKPYGAKLLILPEDGSVDSHFLFKVSTLESNQEAITKQYNENGYVVVSGSTSFVYVNDLTTLVPTGFQLGNSINNFTEDFPSDDLTPQGNGKYYFSTKLTNLEPGKTYFYRAYTYDGLNYNYGDTCSFKIEEQQSDDKVVMLMQNVGGTTYEIYKINTDKNDYHINPDGWKCYKSSLMLDMTKNEKTSTYTLDDNIYLDSSESHHGGQRPCLYLSSSSDQLFIFINSKDSRNSYTMDGYAYRTSLSNVSFTRETVFTGRNWGWSPYFTYNDGVLSVQHFSYAGYYAMTSYRNSDGTWTTKQGNYIKPDAFNEQSEQAGNVLIDDNPGLALSQTQLSIIKGGSATVEITAGSGEYGVTNLNSSIARGTLQGTTVTIDGVAVGNDAKIVVTDMQTGQKIIITVSVTGGGDIPSYTTCPDAHHPHLIDLGLPSGTKWACCNVGAQKPEDYGGYFAWGETTEKSSYTSDNYLDGKETTYDIGKDIAGTQYDAATANWGSPWVMPSKEQMEELINYCTSEWITENGVSGRRFTGSNGVSIFLPASGYRWYGDLGNASSDGYYWSSVLYVRNTSCAFNLYFNSGYNNADRSYRNRHYGQSVRPVCKN